jgi:putative hydrolase of the HAD superfamily
MVTELESILSLNNDDIRNNFASARLIVKGRLGNTASSHSRLLYLSELFSILKFDLETNEILKVEKIYWEAFLSKTDSFPNSIMFIDKLASLGTECALVTDLTSEIQYRKLDILGLESSFCCVVTSEEAGGDKLTLRPWKLLDERVGLSSFSSIWYIGDSKYDFNPSMRRAWDYGFLKTKQGRLTPCADHYSFSSFADLDQLIK